MSKEEENMQRKDRMSRDLDDGLSDVDALSKEDIEQVKQEEMQTVSKPDYPREESEEGEKDEKCIKPCPKFDCVLEPETCNVNCNQTLENPKMICSHNCSTKLQEILLKPEVQKYQKYAKLVEGKDVSILYPETIGKKRSKLLEKKEKLEEKRQKVLNYIDESIWPDKIAKKLKKKKLNKINSAIKIVEARLDEQVELFK